MGSRAGFVLALMSIAIGTSDLDAEQRGGLVEGDRALLELLSAAQITAKSSFPRGSLDASVHSSNGGDKVEASAHVIWDGPSTYWKYQQSVRNQSAEPQLSEGEMIETEDLLICYWPQRKLAQIVRDGLYGYRSELKLRPEQRWFGVLGGARDWSDFFDVGTDERPPKVAFEKIEVHGGQDEIVVRRHLNGGGSSASPHRLRSGATS